MTLGLGIPDSFATMITINLAASLLFGFTSAITLIVSLMLYYHWIRFSVGVVSTFAVMIVYALGVAVLLLAALGLLSQL